AGLLTLAIFAFSPSFESSEIENEVIINGSKNMEVNSAIYYTYQGEPALIIRIQTNESLSRGIQAPDGSWWISFSAVCTHENARVEFIFDETNPEKSIIYCPAHDGKFQVTTGEVISGPPPTPLPGIVLEDKGSELWAVGFHESEEHSPSLSLFMLIFAIPVVPILYHLLKGIMGKTKSEPEKISQ
ncbi:MAG: QcrA and Rieske domain-containing protein, partial [Candidatus Hodarchaeales archaeon]